MATKNAPGADGARVYSYIRFSSPEQELGDSERRQLDAATRYADKRGLRLDDTLRMTDRGLSGYHGHNRTRGALGAFLASVTAGQVPPGSTLVVENIGRLSREDFVQAIETVTGIIKHGITIATLMPFAEYNRESLQGGMVHQLVGQMQMAHEESAKKSERGKETWIQKRRNVAAGGEILTARRPAWLDVAVDGRTLTPAEVTAGVDHATARFVINKPAAAAVAMLFELRSQGLGCGRIERRLNETAPWRPSNGWRESYIKKTLCNRAVIGDYQPHVKQDGRRVPVGDVIKGYYPAVVDAATYHAVQQRQKENRGRGGRTDKATNLFTYLVRCAYCGGPMRVHNKGLPPKGYTYLQCDRGMRRSECKPYSVRYDEAERVILDNCHKLQPGEVLPAPDEQARQGTALRRRAEGLAAEIADVEQQINNLTDQIARTSSQSQRDRYEVKVATLEGQQQGLQAQHATTSAALQEAERGEASVKAWQRDLQALHAALQTGGADVRLQLRSHLRGLIDRIEVFAVGFTRRHDPETDRRAVDVEEFAEYVDAAVGETNPGLARGREWCAFLEYVTQRRMSREGRFYRIHYRTGARTDVVPPGSLASGRVLIRSGRGRAKWQFVQPQIDGLWEEFKRDQTVQLGKPRRTAGQRGAVGKSRRQQRIAKAK